MPFSFSSLLFFLSCPFILTAGHSYGATGLYCGERKNVFTSGRYEMFFLLAKIYQLHRCFIFLFFWIEVVFKVFSEIMIFLFVEYTDELKFLIRPYETSLQRP